MPFCLVDQMQLGCQNIVMEMQFLLEEILVNWIGNFTGTRVPEFCGDAVFAGRDSSELDW